MKIEFALAAEPLSWLLFFLAWFVAGAGWSLGAWLVGRLLR